ncbi:MAG TPA: MFS transporter [Bryobacteraceae bacterium]|nr:MFS transporter [Bryobacteraceae bacterium]
MSSPKVRPAGATRAIGDSATTGSAVPTNVRYKVLNLTFVLAFIMYLDRVCMGTTAPTIMKEFGLDKVTMGWSASAFNWAYAMFQVPAGWMADRYGPRAVLAGALVWWSLFTAATGMSFNALSLAVTRFFFGMGEAAAFPASSRAVVRWLPLERRAVGQGFQHAGSRLGAALAPAIVVALMVRYDWRSVFFIFGAIGVFFAIVWYVYYRNYPEDHAGVNSAELELLRSSGFSGKAARTNVPWRIILRSRDLWFLSAMYFCYGWVLWMYLFWFPTYLVEARNFSTARMGLGATLPLLAATVTNVAGGWISDSLTRRWGDLKRGRLVVSMLGFALAGVGLIPGVLVESPAMAIACLTIALASLELTVAVSWAVALDIGGDYSGSVSSVMNTLGNIGGASSAVAIGYLATHFGWNWPFMVASLMCIIAAVLATQIDPTRSAVTAVER